MLIRFANKEDFDEIFRDKEFAYYSWDYIEDAAKALNMKNISLYIEYENKKFIIPLIKWKVFGFYPVALSISSGLYGGITPKENIDEKIYVFLMNKIKTHIKMGIVFQNFFQEEIFNNVGFTKIKEAYTHIVQTNNKNYDEYFRKEFSHGMREGVKKAIKNNVKIIVGNSIGLIEDFYKLYESSNIRWGKKQPRYGIDFFKSFSNKEYFEIRIAYYQGQPTGALVMLKFKNYYIDWFAAMNKELRNSRANEYLHADLIKDSIEHNYTMINFGASGKLTGVKGFKTSLGAKENSYNTYFIGNTIAKAMLYFIMKIFY